jgi:hypothetical protein
MLLTSLPSTSDYRNLSSERSARPLHDAYADHHNLADRQGCAARRNAQRHSSGEDIQTAFGDFRERLPRRCACGPWLYLSTLHVLPDQRLNVGIGSFSRRLGDELPGFISGAAVVRYRCADYRVQALVRGRGGGGDPPLFADPDDAHTGQHLQAAWSRAARSASDTRGHVNGRRGYRRITHSRSCSRAHRAPFHDYQDASCSERDG